MYDRREIIDYLIKMGSSMCEAERIVQDHEERVRARRSRGDCRSISMSEMRALKVKMLADRLSKDDPKSCSTPLTRCLDLEEMLKHGGGRDPSWVMAGRLAYHLMKNFEMTDTQIRSDFRFTMSHYNGSPEIIITDERAVRHMTARIYIICVGGMLFEFNPKRGVVQVLPPRSSIPSLKEYRSIIKQTFRTLKVTMKGICNKKKV